MKQLTSRSILSCDELEVEIHHAELERVIEAIINLDDWTCDVETRYLDDYHKQKNQPVELSTTLHEVFNLVQARDIKNGVDAFLTDEGDLAFIAYGQGYSYKGKHDIIKEQVLVKALDQEGKRVDFTPVLSRLHQPDLENKKEATL
ncbi:TPA: hypothetical protein ACGYRP_000300 [Streptococcus pyogenes]|uniref:hypothetical protein n=1 Tax=Streptococcus pyogenes TaxID=1314 RepID=UPI00109D17CF|nr:hypothetical protein [Streptococcus pyogenes]QCK38923.1 hypothetical protein ETT65_05140 [Streptococcus pyogenes]VGT90260.1 Uncharacterised protein [Streptococcus pyogenes]VGV98472.1 Uncharacterised protein [Streptococcus pyogenes]VGW88407.1 Uncharacterised protein [Streptococcus pyogenes]VGZ97086.1 Uncharacterised protein [Streptococcus pyogenes]